jgi:hypothetical protein
MHLQHCEAIQANPTLTHVYGVKRYCLLDELKFFSVSENFSVDIMHDILEGVAQYEMKLIFEYLKSDFISHRELQAWIVSFNYGYTESRNKPPGVRLEEGIDLGLNAIQTWCFVRNMPLIFGDVLQRGDKCWQLLLLLVNIAFSPILTEGLTICLKHFIAEHHRLFKHLFPSKRLLPKHPFLIHYPRLRLLGPVLHMWSMRYESKNYYFKRQLKSFKNVTKTQAIKHQSDSAYTSGLASTTIKKGPGKMVALCDVNEGDNIALYLNVSVEISVLKVKWAKVHGTEYRPKLIICSSVDIDLPKFCQIRDIIVKDEEVLLISVVLHTCCFDKHFHSFKVSFKEVEEWMIVSINEIVYHKPFDLQMTFGRQDDFKYIVSNCVFI